MYKSRFGRNGQVNFSCPEDYYELLGYLAKSDGTTSITWENNEDQGAWGSEGRICFYSRRLPLSVFCVIRQELVQSTRELIAMILLNIFRDIMVSCKVNIRISNLFAEQFLHNISLALNEG